MSGFIIWLGFVPSLAGAAQKVREMPVDQLHQWPDFSKRQSQSLQALQRCKKDERFCESPEVARWAGLIQELSGQNRLRQIITVNRWFNQVPYRLVETPVGEISYWADTRELLRERGDCQDFALSKYYTLRQLGFSPDEMRVTVVFDQDTYAHHAVLMVYIDGTRYMLDILSNQTNPTPMGTRYRPIYSFNEQTAWVY